MKLLKLWAAIPIAVLSMSSPAQSGHPCLVAQYNFTGNADDLTGSGNDGVVQGATLATDRFGNPNRAYSFDGVDDGISILKQPNLNMGAGDFSVEAWINVPASSAGNAFAFLNYAGNATYFWGLTGNRPYVFFRTDGAPDPAESVQATGPNSLNDAQWHHVVGVRSGATALIYVDGTEVDSQTNPAIPSSNGGSVDTGICQYARIGASNTGLGHCGTNTPNPGEPFFEGRIDDVKIYNCALTAAEIGGVFAVPTLSQWGLILLGLIIVVLSASSSSVKRAQQSS